MSASLPSLAFAGLGLMGVPMCRRLLAAGYPLAVWNRSPGKRELLAAEGAKAVEVPAELAADAEILMLCLADTAAVREVVFGAGGIVENARPGQLLVDFSSAEPAATREMAAELEARCGVRWVDAPVSGGQAGAVNGALTVMVGGEEAFYRRAEPLLRSYARMVRRMGDVGSGQLTKMVNQICVAGLLQGLAEALHFAQCAGLDGEAAMQVIGKGAAQSWQLENRHQSMLAGEFDFGFAVDWMRKDLSILLAEARRNGAQLPVTALVDQFYAEVQAMGGGRWDTSSLIARLRS